MTKSIEKMSDAERLKSISKIIERVDNRCMTHATVSPTLEEMQQSEISEIYALSTGNSKFLKD